MEKRKRIRILLLEIIDKEVGNGLSRREESYVIVGNYIWLSLVGSVLEVGEKGCKNWENKHLLTKL